MLWTFSVLVHPTQGNNTQNDVQPSPDNSNGVPTPNSAQTSETNNKKLDCHKYPLIIAR